MWESEESGKTDGKGRNTNETRGAGTARLRSNKQKAPQGR